MAAGVRLKLKFGTAVGPKTWTFNYAKTNVSTGVIKDLADTMIANGSIFKTPPLSKVSAELEQTTSTVININ